MFTSGRDRDGGKETALIEIRADWHGGGEVGLGDCVAVGLPPWRSRHGASTASCSVSYPFTNYSVRAS